MPDRPAVSPLRPTAVTRLVAVALCVLAAYAAVAVSHVPSAQAASGARLDRSERKVIRMVNEFRLSHGLPRVHASRTLGRSADFHSWDMARRGFFAHSSSSGASFSARVRAYSRARSTGENLAFVNTVRGTSPAARVMSMWLNSPGHRAVLLDPRFRRIGVARRAGRIGSQVGQIYTADFSSRR